MTYDKPSFEDEKYTNIRLNLNKDRHDYKIVVKNAARKTNIDYLLDSKLEEAVVGKS